MWRRVVLLFAVLVGAGACFGVYSAASIARETKGLVFGDLKQVPRKRVGLVLGCSSRLGGGLANPYFSSRVEAAAALQQAGVVEYLLVSGDNGSRDYDEPTTFKAALVARGVPEDRIVLDYAGFRTLDSVIRARRLGMSAVGYVADDVTGPAGTKTRVREWFARAKAVIDLKVGTRPRFLGPKLPIGVPH
jgi:SanA protein